MIALQILVLIFIFFAISRVYLRFRDKLLGKGELFFWFVVWAVVLILVFDPRISDMAASFLGIRRGTDTILIIASVLSLYLIFRLYVKLDSIDRDLTQLTINVSKKIHKENKKNEQ